MTEREEHNELLRELMEWYEGERDFLIEAIMPDDVPPGFEPKSEQQEWDDFSKRGPADWAMRGERVGVRRRNEEFTRYLKMKAKHG